nr:chaperone protein DnaJ 8, chloroplastic-like [Tanacetum cinerariifolium]
MVMTDLRGETSAVELEDEPLDDTMRDPDWDMWEEWMGWEGAGIQASSLETSLRRNVWGGAEQAQLIVVSEVSSNITLAPQADRYN